MKHRVVGLAVALGGAVLALPLQAETPAQAPDAGAQCTITVPQGGLPVANQGCADYVEAGAADAEKAARLYRVAFSLNEKPNGAIAAVPLLERAVKLDPTRADILTELAYARADVGSYREALAAVDKALALKPGFALALTERAFVRRRLGDFAGAATDTEAKIATAGGMHEDFLALARDKIWLGKLDEAQALIDRVPGTQAGTDGPELRGLIKRMRAYKSPGDPAQACDLQDLGKADAAARIVDACTAAFLAAKTDAERAAHLTTRSTAQVFETRQPDAGFEDLQVAVGLDPKNPNNWTNYANALLMLRRSWAARRAYDEALAIIRDKSGSSYGAALVGRARASYNSGDRAAAVADLREAERIAPSAYAQLVLGDIAYDDGDKDAAKTAWQQAWAMGMQDDTVRERFAAIGEKAPEGAKTSP